ncbi:hypothetical protein [Bacillus nitratireducens]|uniref:hypothetical protein n=1 Tax=Bacillus nitratireducens TaxID=2026193 RepID=UPI002E1BEA7B|nr:hypothetical protein [Bacillus nitratireducens]
MQNIEYINRDTGEIVTREQLRRDLSEETRRMSVAQKEGYEYRRRSEAYKNDGNPTFLKYSRSLRSIHDKMTIAQASVLLRLSLHLYMKGDGLIKTDRWISQFDANAMAVSEMAITVGKSRYGLSKILDHLQNIGAIVANEQDNKRTSYSISEKYISYGSGQDMDKSHVKVYRKALKRTVNEMPNKKEKRNMQYLTDQEAGTLFKLLAYVHEEHYILCANPTERDMTKVSYMTIEELAKAVGISTNSFRNTLTGLRKKGIIARFCSGITVNRGAAHVLNPNIVDCGALNNVNTSGTVRSLFEITSPK